MLGVGVSATTLEGALREVTRWVEQGDRRYVCLTSVHGVMESQRNGELLRIHNDAGLTIADGLPLLWAGRIAGASNMERLRGSDFLIALCDLAATRGWSCFFFGGAPGTPELLAARLRARFPSLRVAGTYSPPFRPFQSSENGQMVERINASGADLVLVGLSTPKQERWMAANRVALDATALVGVGMAFDVHAGLKPQAPLFIQKSGFEWLYRLAHEPRRLWRRYLWNVPRFLLHVLRRHPFMRPDTGAD